MCREVLEASRNVEINVLVWRSIGSFEQVDPLFDPRPRIFSAGEYWSGILLSAFRYVWPLFMLLFDHATRVTWKVTSPGAPVDRVRGTYIIRVPAVRCCRNTRKSKRFTCTCIVDASRAQSNLHAERPRILIRSCSVSSSRLNRLYTRPWLVSAIRVFPNIENVV